LQEFKEAVRGAKMAAKERKTNREWTRTTNEPQMNADLRR
jgi:hypothetical protein